MTGSTGSPAGGSETLLSAMAPSPTPDSRRPGPGRAPEAPRPSCQEERGRWKDLMGQPVCRACRGRAGELVLDLGEQPAADHFPRQDDPGPDPVYPLQMWLCASCGLAQLIADPTVPEEPRGAEPAALVTQAADAVARAAAAGFLPRGGRIAEYGSPHGGSWLNMLAPHGLVPAADPEQAQVVLDCFGLMHAPDQSQALAQRVSRVAPEGVLLLQYHSLGAIVRLGQWNALRHGHYAYYSTRVLMGMLAAHGFSARTAWRFDLYGGTVLLAAGRDDDGVDTDQTVTSLLRCEDEIGITSRTGFDSLQRKAEADTERVRRWLVAQRVAGGTVVGYGAASRAVALLARAGLDRSLLPAVVDASVAKQGRRMPGTDIPIVSPAYLEDNQPRSVLLFLPDLMPEVREAIPGVEASGGRWVDAATLEL
jgi:hypothetical protein